MTNINEISSPLISVGHNMSPPTVIETGRGITDLPTEIIDNIFTYLNGREISRDLSVCKNWMKIGNKNIETKIRKKNECENLKKKFYKLRKKYKELQKNHYKQ